MRISIDATRHSVTELVGRIDTSNRSACLQILDDHIALFLKASGSTHNHQVWPGGYYDHVEEVMNIAVVLHQILGSLRPLPFSLSDALLVLFLHDIEKPWRFEIGADGMLRNLPGLETKEGREAFRVAKLAEYGIVLTPAQANGLKYVEGEHKDYSSTHRVSNELAAFCHLCDSWSARGWHDHPAAEGDPWPGAKRTSP